MAEPECLKTSIESASRNIFLYGLDANKHNSTDNPVVSSVDELINPEETIA